MRSNFNMSGIGKMMVVGWGALALAGCAVGPDYKKLTPEQLKMPKEYANVTNQPATVPTTGPSADSQGVLDQWWTQFDDPKLESLIMRGLAGNLDLKTAEARVREARAVLGIFEADLYPTVSVDGSFSRNRSSGNMVRSPAAGSTASSASTRNLYRAGFDASWEIDVFGSNRRAIEAATADLASIVEQKRSVMITLAGDIATNYINYRGLQRQLVVAYDNLRSQNESVDLTGRKFNAGLTSELDVARARAQVATTASTIPSIEQALRQTLHGLAVLLGKEPNALVIELAEPQPIPNAPMVVPAGLPSDLLRRRPDVRKAEQALHAANARSGEAEANLYPRFSLTGSFGWESYGTGNLFTKRSNAWSIGPAISWPIFDAWRLHNNLKVRNAQTEQALLQYEQVVLVALRDVENSLVGLAKEQTRRASLAQAVDANKRSVELANQLYQRGLGDFLSVITAEQLLFQAQDQLARSEALVSTNLVSLYKALGGGWEVPPMEKETRK